MIRIKRTFTGGPYQPLTDSGAMLGLLRGLRVRGNTKTDLTG
jgi:hypothetical protein